MMLMVVGTMPLVTFEVEVKLMGKNLQAMMNQTLEMMLPQFIMKCKWWHIND
jgi:hypothetical protein